MAKRVFNPTIFNMKRKLPIYIAFLTIILTFSCASQNQITKDNYIVLDKEGMQFTIYSSLAHHKELSSDSVLVCLKSAKMLARKELGQYHIIEPCIIKKDSIFHDIELKVDKSFNQTDQLLKYKIDSCFIDDFIKKRIVKKFGAQYKF